MIKIYLIRHGEASEGWTSQDPPLSELGKSQAKSLMTFVDSIFDENSTNNTNAISSPLSRCKETASLALEKQYLEIAINDNFRELPSPTIDLEKRVNWLRRILPLTWPELLKDKETIESGVNFIQWKEKRNQADQALISRITRRLAGIDARWQHRQPSFFFKKGNQANQALISGSPDFSQTHAVYIVCHH